MSNLLQTKIRNPASRRHVDSTCFQKSFFVSLILVAAMGHLAVGQSKPDLSSKQAWVSFRNGGKSDLGPDTVLPKTWAPKQGIAWQVDLPGYGQSSPIIFDDNVLVTAVEGPNKETNLVICLDRSTGDERWRTSQQSTQPAPSNFMHSRAAPTPVTDAEHAFALFESGDLIAVSLKDGRKLWALDLKAQAGELKSNHGLGSSLAQSSDSVFVNLEHGGPSSLIAIRKSDGTTKWEAKRPSGSSWSSPVVMERNGASQVIVSSGGEAAGYDSESGKEIWKIENLAGNTVPSPLVFGNKVLLGARIPEFGSVGTAAKSNLCLEFEDDSNVPTVRWRSKRCVADYASPVICQDDVFLVNGIGVVGCLDKETGEEKYRKRLGMVCWATPIVSNDHVYFFGKNGKTTVIKAGGDFSVVSQNYLWDEASPPAPTSYVEHFPENKNAGHHRSGRTDGKGDSNGSRHGASHGNGGSPGSGMLARMLKRDSDGDGLLTGEEIPKRLVAAMENIDLDKDGSLDAAELKKMADSFAEKRKGSRSSSRDPIVYGVAADSDGILVRTGTRVFAIGGQPEQ